RRAGVSQTTVSFVLNRNKTGKISETTAAKVWEAARELGYVPDAAARSLARGYSMNIALVMTNPHKQVLIDDYIPNVITGLMESAGADGFRVVLELVKDDDPVNVIQDLARGREVAGIIIAPNEHTDRYMEILLNLNHEDFPLVTLRHLADSIASVTSRNLDGIRAMTEHLIDLGHERIACISYASSAVNPHVAERLDMLRKTMQAQGLDLPAAYIKEGQYDPSTGYTAAQELLDLDTPPTAIQCLNDTMALGAMAAVQDAGLRVPDDIAVVGFDDIRVAAYTNPPLTTVRAQEIQLGEQAGRAILDMLHNQPPVNRHIELPTELIVRSSCGAKPTQTNNERTGA
ncbi:MAG: LacI family DNA-binding transcriptional regulator, partial [Chloroflexota bacterium]